MSEECVFRFKYGKDCEQNSNGLQQNSKPDRIQFIISASFKYGDNLHTKLEEQLVLNPELKISYHKNCVSRYTSKSNLPKDTPWIGETEEPPRKLRKSTLQFNFRKHCLYCGKTCSLEKNPKNPARWREAYLCRSTKSKHENQDYKQFLLELYDYRNDEWAGQVRLRIEGTLDLYAADARYHKDYSSLFRSLRNIQSNISQQETDANDPGLDAVFTFMQENKNAIWNTVELYDVYCSSGTRSLSRKIVIEKIKERFGDDVIILSSIIAFTHSASSVMKSVKD